MGKTKTPKEEDVRMKFVGFLVALIGLVGFVVGFLTPEDCTNSDGKPLWKKRIFIGMVTFFIGVGILWMKK